MRHNILLFHYSYQALTGLLWRIAYDKASSEYSWRSERRQHGPCWQLRWNHARYVDLARKIARWKLRTCKAFWYWVFSRAAFRRSVKFSANPETDNGSVAASLWHGGWQLSRHYCLMQLAVNLLQFSTMWFFFSCTEIVLVFVVI